jgi:hypothetical protein
MMGSYIHSWSVLGNLYIVDPGVPLSPKNNITAFVGGGVVVVTGKR